MRTFRFDKNKYGKPLKMDMGNVEDIPEFFLSDEPHCTDFYEILIFKEDNGHIVVDSRKISIKKGRFLFISPFQRRSWRLQKPGLRAYFLIFEKDFLSDFFADELFVYRLQYFYNLTVPTYFRPKKRIFSFKHDIFDEVKEEINNYQEDSPHLLRSILYYMLIKMNREFCAFHNLGNETHLNNYAYRFKEALEHNYRTKQKVGGYADLLKISRVTLNASVKKQFGVTPKQMIKDRLLSEIKSELIFSTKTISEIAFDLRFSEPNNLIRFFKSATGKSPKRFKKDFQKDGQYPIKA